MQIVARVFRKRAQPATGCHYLNRRRRQETSKMPSRIPRPCRKHGCPHTTTAQYGYCEQHKNEGWVQHQRGRTRQQQGYGRAWEILRAKILKRDKYLCQTCLRQGIATEAKAVDHIRAKAFGGTDDETNLQAICHACHGAKTAKEH